MSRSALPRPVSLYQRAKVLLENRGVYVPNPNRKNIVTAIGRYEGNTTPMHISVEQVDRIITAWVEKYEGFGVSHTPAGQALSDCPERSQEVVEWKPLKLSREMRAQIARCDPTRLPE